MENGAHEARATPPDASTVCVQSTPYGRKKKKAVQIEAAVGAIYNRGRAERSESSAPQSSSPGHARGVVWRGVARSEGVQKQVVACNTKGLEASVMKP